MLKLKVGFNDRFRPLYLRCQIIPSAARRGRPVAQQMEGPKIFHDAGEITIKRGLKLQAEHQISERGDEKQAVEAV